MFEKFIQHIQTHKKFHLVWLLLITVICTIFISGIKIGDRQILEGLRIDNSMEVWFRDDDPDWLQYERFQKQFEGDEYAVIAFQADDIFQPEVLAKIKDLTDKSEDLPYISQVVSLTNVEYFRGEKGILKTSPLFETIPTDPGKLKKMRDMIVQHPLYVDNVISANGKTTAIIIRLRMQPEGVNYQRQVTDLVYELCEKENENGKYTFHVSGAPILLGVEDRASTDDAALEYSIMFFILVMLLYLLHRRVVYVVIPLSVITIANLWIHGIIPLCGSSYNMITNIIAMLVMVIGIADTIHFIAEYNTEIQKGKSRPDSVRDAFKLIVRPCLFTSLTTAVGFMSMAVSQLQVVKEFGIYAGIAMLMTFVINMVLVSIWLSSLKKNPDKTPGQNENGIIQKLMRWVASVNRKHVKVNIAIAVAIFLVSLTGLIRIEINTHEIKYFRENHPLRVATDFIEENLTGIVPLEIMLSGPPDAFKQPDILKRMEKLENYVGSIDHMQKTFSAVDYIKEMHKAMNDGNNTYYSIPKSKEMVSDLLFLAEGSDELDCYVDTMDYSVARVHGRFKYVDTNEMEDIVHSVEKKISELFDNVGIKAEITGMLPMYLHAEDYILDSQINGFSLALIVIFIMLSILVRSLKLGLISMVPNIIPIFLTFGIMGWLNIYLDMGTILIASIAISLAVDDTIHFIARFRHYFDEYQNYDLALDQTLYSVGSPILITSVVLFFGFGVLVVSTFMPIVYFGLLAAVTMISALLADLFVLPALIKVFKPFGPEAEITSSREELSRAGV